MQKLFTIITSVKLKQLLTVFLAGCLLTVSTACNQGTNLAQSAETVKTMSDTYDDYDAKQSFKGGMNGYNDDRRYGGETAAKSKTLVDAAKRRQKNNIGDYVESTFDRAGDKIDAAKNEIPSELNANRFFAVDYVQDKSENLKDNLRKVPGGVKEVFGEATDTAEAALNDVNKAAKKTTKNIKGDFEDLT